MATEVKNLAKQTSEAAGASYLAQRKSLILRDETKKQCAGIEKFMEQTRAVM